MMLVDVVVLCSNGYFTFLDVAGPVIKIGRRILDAFFLSSFSCCFSSSDIQSNPHTSPLPVTRPMSRGTTVTAFSYYVSISADWPQPQEQSQKRLGKNANARNSTMSWSPLVLMYRRLSSGLSWED